MRQTEDIRKACFEMKAFTILLRTLVSSSAMPITGILRLRSASLPEHHGRSLYHGPATRPYA